MSKQYIYDLLNRDYEKPFLEDLYKEYGIATDQLRREPKILARIVDAFNSARDRDLSPELLLRYMFNRRKAKDWPCLGNSAKKLPATVDILSSDDFAVLRRIYLDLDEPSDELLFKSGLTREVAKRFRNLAGKSVRGSLLIAAIIAKRKRGVWVQIRKPFGDIEDIADL